MPDMNAPLKMGINNWNQYSDWPSFLRAQQRADELGFDSIWTWDHVYPIVGSHEGPIFEGYTAMAAVATMTRNASIGLLVGANTFRNPALVAKMVTTLDHISGGRAILGIGAAWFETEHEAFGLEFGDGPPERLRWLREALPIMRAMLDGERTTTTGRYTTEKALNLPAPIQQRVPILIGGAGPKVTLRLVAEYGDMNNIGRVTADELAEKERALAGHCEAVGRDEQAIERTAGMGPCFIRDSREEAFTVMADVFADNGNAKTWTDMPVGHPSHIVEHCKPYLDAGYRHLIFGSPAPYDDETLERLATEVRPELEAYLASQGKDS